MQQADSILARRLATMPADQREKSLQAIEALAARVKTRRLTASPSVSSSAPQSAGVAASLPSAVRSQPRA